MNKIKLFYILLSLISLFTFIYFGIGMYIAYDILKIDHSCGAHTGSQPNNWSTKLDYLNSPSLTSQKLRRDFDSSKYHIDKWQEVDFPSRDKNIQISGWLFNFFKDRPIVIVVHGLYPNGKCKPESNLITSLLIKNKINALSIDLRNYGQSTIVSEYENLGLSEYKDVLGAYDFLKQINFNDDEIGLVGISLGASTVIFAAKNESRIKAIWSESSLAEFKMILQDEISRYGVPHDFGLAVSLSGKFLTGIDPTQLSPIYSLTNKQNYFFTHGENDKRIPKRHFELIKKYSQDNNINADFWLVKNANHVDAMLMHSEEYGLKMKNFFEKNLK
tara:strand:+ start:76 stop:1068 length:993 start_codon:yes stop_codon:yes gene_type:complete